MRDIEFRVWLKSKKQMRYDVTALEHLPLKGIDGPFIDGDFYDIEDCVLMQYTGLTDKNGKKIFEGDIIKNHCGYKAVVKFGKYKYDVMHTGFYIQDIEFNDIFNLTDLDIEVIGNIYENKELLGDN